MKDFLSSDHDDIYDPVFLAQMVLSPLNTIVDFLIDFAVKNKIYRNSDQDRHVHAKLKVLFRYEILTFMLRTLAKYGKQPYITRKQQPFVSKLINNQTYGIRGVTHKNEAVSVTGFTAAFFLTLPELFVQWSKFKDSPKSEQPQDSVINFEGLECFWPTFSTPTKKRKKDEEPADVGCMFSNEESSRP
jgi:hypothetical protein